MRSILPFSIVLALSVCTSAPSTFQTAPAPPQGHIESTEDLLATLTPEQKGEFDTAGKAFAAQRYDQALATYKLLLKDHPGDPVLSKFASEAALNTGDPNFAAESLKPVAQGNPNDWQAAALLTRASAESGDKSARDAGIVHMLDLHKRGITPPRLQQYIVERVKTPSGSVLIFTSLEPWGHYQVYRYAQIFDSGNRLLLRATIESNDGDQPLFAKQHPEKASAGLRGFSLDGYRDTGANNSNQKSETHYTFKFFESEPAYDTVREEFINVAIGKTKPVSSRVSTLGQ